MKLQVVDIEGEHQTPKQVNNKFNNKKNLAGGENQMVNIKTGAP